MTTQREKLARLGGAEWVRGKIDRVKGNVMKDQVQQANDSRTKLDSLKEQPKQINPHSYDFYYGILLKDYLKWGASLNDTTDKKDINLEALESIDQITRKILELKGC